MTSYNQEELRRQVATVKESVLQNWEQFQQQHNKVQNINAIPIKDNIKEWHFNVWPTKGKYKGLCFHGSIEFGRNYPTKPPTIEVFNKIVQKNINAVNSRYFVELDCTSEENWKPSLSIVKLLEELSDAFNNKPSPKTDVAERSKMSEQISMANCMWCGHKYEDPYPSKQLKYIIDSHRDIKDMKRKANIPVEVKNEENQWNDARIIEIECDYGKVYYEAYVLKSELGQNNLTTLRLGWCLKDTEPDFDSGEFEHIAIGNRWFLNRVGGNIIHKKPYEITAKKEVGIGPKANDYVICAVDFKNRSFSFFINGRLIAVKQMPKTFENHTLIPVVGLQQTHVQLRFTGSHFNIPELKDYFTIQEFEQQDKGSYLWEYGDDVEWNELFRYGITPKELNNESSELIKKTNEFVLNVFSSLPYKDLCICRGVCGLWNHVIVDSNLLYQCKLSCWHTKKTYEDNDTILALMLNVEFEKNTNQRKQKSRRSKRKNNSVNVISSLNISKDFISVKSFKNIKVDTENIKYSHILPVIIQNKHGNKAINIIRDSIVSLMGNKNYNDTNAFHLLCEMMNYIVCSISDEFGTKSIPSKEFLEHSLNIFCSLDHVLLYLNDINNNNMYEEAKRVLANFIADESCRSKESAPSLGRIAIMLLYSKQNWHDLRRSWLEELFARDVSNYIHNKQELENVHLPAQKRLEYIFANTVKARREALLIVFFVTVIKRLRSSFGNDNNSQYKNNLSKALQGYNNRFGSPGDRWLIRLHSQCEELISIKSWQDFFKKLYVNLDDTEKINKIFITAMNSAAQKQYYQPFTKLNVNNVQTNQHTNGKPPNMMNRQDSWGAKRDDYDERFRNSNGNRINDYRDNRDIRNNRDRDIRNRDRDRDNRNNDFRNNNKYRFRDDENRRPRRMDRSRGSFMGRNRNDRDRDNRYNNNNNNNNNTYDNRNIRDDRDRDRDRDRNNRGRNYGYNNRNDRDRDRDRDNNNNNRRGGYNNRNTYDNRNRGGPRNNRRGYRGDDREMMKEQFEFTQTTKHATKFYAASKITSLDKMPEFVKSGFSGENIESLNTLQKESLGLMTIGEDILVVSPAGSGKTTLVIMSALYRLYIKKDPCHILILVATQQHVANVVKRIKLYGKNVPDLKVEGVSKLRSDRLPPKSKFQSGRNIFVATPQPAEVMASQFDNVQSNSYMNNLKGVYVLAGDILLGDLWTKTKLVFGKIPTGIPVGIFSNSWCGDMDKPKKLLTKTPNFINHGSQQRISHLFTVVQDYSQLDTLLCMICELNPYKQGIIFVDDEQRARKVKEELKKNRQIVSYIIGKTSMEREINNLVDQFVKLKVKYLICTDLSPIHLLWKTQSRVIINRSCKSTTGYVMRSHCSSNDTIDVISLIHQSQANFWSHVESSCNITIQELSDDVTEGFKAVED